MTTIQEQIDNLDRRVFEYWSVRIEDFTRNEYIEDTDFTRDEWVDHLYESFMTEREDTETDDPVNCIGTEFITTELMTYMIETIHKKEIDFRAKYNQSPLPLQTYTFENLLEEYVDYYRLEILNKIAFGDIIDDYEAEQKCLYVLK